MALTRDESHPWHESAGLEFAWIGRPRLLRAGASSGLGELNHDLPRNWAQAGPLWLDQVRGSWALFVHDPRRRRLWAATDRFATVPILYRRVQGQGGMIFSTELADLLHCEEASPGINPKAVLQFLTLRHVADRQHLVADVHRILPGTAVCVNYANARLAVTEQPYLPQALKSLAEEPGAISEPASIARIRQALDDELADGWGFHNSVAGQKAGMLYSGGLDSAFLAGRLDEPMREQLELTTYGFDDQSADLEFARASVRDLGSLGEHWTPLRLRSDETPVLLDRIIRETSLPVEHPNFLARRLAYEQLAEKGVRTVIAGEGADTLLGGAWYVTMQKVLDVRGLSDRYRIPRRTWDIAARLHRSRRDLFRLLAEPDWRMVCVLAKAYVPFDWLSSAARSLGPWSADSFPYHTAILDRVGPQAKLAAIYELGLMANMSAELAAEEAMSRQCGMVQWNPYLDGLFPDRIASIPLSLRTKNRRAKHLLYQAARDSVPRVCLDRPKSGCPAPLVTWLSDPKGLRPQVDALEDPGSFCMELLGPEAVQGPVGRFRRNPSARDAEVLWVLINLERWNALILKNRFDPVRKGGCDA